jgi:hypothetical protein
MEQGAREQGESLPAFSDRRATADILSEAYTDDAVVRITATLKVVQAMVHSLPTTQHARR